MVCVFGNVYQPSGWITAMLTTAAVTPVALGLLYFAGLDSSDRRLIQDRFNNLRRRFFDSLPKQHSRV